MAYIYQNLNPCHATVGDCVIRAIAKVTGMDWESVYINLCEEGLNQCNLPNANSVFDKFLRRRGFRKHVLPDTCPSCYTVEQFCHHNPEGEFILDTGDHAVAVIDGDYFDIFDSGREVVSYLYAKEVY